MAAQYGVDNLNVLFLTPLPGTQLWDKMKDEGRITLDTFPGDWQYYTLTFPVARYAQLSLDQGIDEMVCCNQRFYSVSRIMGRIWRNLWRWRKPFVTIVANFSYRNNLRLDRTAYANFRSKNGNRCDPGGGHASS